MAVLKILGGLRRFVPGELGIPATTVGGLLRAAPLPAELLFPDGALNRDVEVLVNGRNISFLDGLETSLAPSDRVTLFLHGARGYPGG